jgi:hypothetical protein
VCRTHVDPATLEAVHPAELRVFARLMAS